MPQHKSAKKRVKTNAKSQARNRAARSKLRGFLKDVVKPDPDKKPGSNAELHSTLDKAATKGIISKNKAGRLKSRLSS